MPGRKVEVLAGSSDEPVSLFSGIIVKQALKVRDHTSPQLVVDCRHEAVKLTVGRKNACYVDVNDDDILSSILDAAGIDADLAIPGPVHPQLVQFRSTDWDFLLARARANGKLVYTTAAGIVIAAPPSGGDPRFTLQFGATILELDVEMDARSQFSAVTSVTWDASQQQLVETEAQDPGFPGPGNLNGDELAEVIGLERFELRHPALPEDEAQAWADAEWLASRMNKVSGRAKCEGIGGVEPGHVVKLAGVGKRYSGDVIVSGVRHDFDSTNGWKTHVQFGALAAAPVAREGAAGGALLPAVNGLQIGVVTSNEDPASEHRIRVRMPTVDAADDGIWARVASLDGGDQRGLFFRPEIGDEVVLGFLDADPRSAVVLGMLHSSAKPPPWSGADENPEKGYRSRSGMELYFNDEKTALEISTPAGNRIALSEDEESLTIADQNGNAIEMTSDGITITSAKILTLSAGTELKLESKTSFAAKSGSDLKLEGTASAELSCAATTTVKGGLVQIN